MLKDVRRAIKFHDLNDGTPDRASREAMESMVLFSPWPAGKPATRPPRVGAAKCIIPLADARYRVAGFPAGPGEIRMLLCVHPELRIEAAVFMDGRDDGPAMTAVGYCYTGGLMPASVITLVQSMDLMREFVWIYQG